MVRSSSSPFLSFEADDLASFDFLQSSPSTALCTSKPRTSSTRIFSSTSKRVRLPSCPLAMSADLDLILICFLPPPLPLRLIGAWLVNTARGAICNAEDVAEALKTGQLAGYGGDVWNVQPAPKDHPLRDARNPLVRTSFISPLSARL
jgi:hypothetical protein